MAPFFEHRTFGLGQGEPLFRISQKNAGSSGVLFLSLPCKDFY